MKIVRHHANSRFDWLISGHQSVNPSREAISILSGKYKRFTFVHPVGLVLTVCVQISPFGDTIEFFVFNRAYCINNSGSVYLSVSVFTFEHGISESNKDLKFECRSVNDLKHNRTQWALVKQAYCSLYTI